jgi:hypothetical protein
MSWVWLQPDVLLPRTYPVYHLTPATCRCCCCCVRCPLLAHLQAPTTMSPGHRATPRCARLAAVASRHRPRAHPRLHSATIARPDGVVPTAPSNAVVTPQCPVAWRRMDPPVVPPTQTPTALRAPHLALASLLTVSPLALILSLAHCFLLSAPSDDTLSYADCVAL